MNEVAVSGKSFHCDGCSDTVRCDREVGVVGVRDREGDTTDAKNTAACDIDFLRESWKLAVFRLTEAATIGAAEALNSSLPDEVLSMGWTGIRELRFFVTYVSPGPHSELLVRAEMSLAGFTGLCIGNQSHASARGIEGEAANGVPTAKRFRCGWANQEDVCLNGFDIFSICVSYILRGKVRSAVLRHLACQYNCG